MGIFNLIIAHTEDVCSLRGNHVGPPVSVIYLPRMAGSSVLNIEPTLDELYPEP